MTPWIEEALIQGIEGNTNRYDSSSTSSTDTGSVTRVAKVESISEWPSEVSEFYPSFRVSDGKHFIMAYKIGDLSLATAKSAFKNDNLLRIRDWRILPEHMVKKEDVKSAKTKFCLVIHGTVEEVQPYPMVDVNDSVTQEFGSDTRGTSNNEQIVEDPANATFLSQENWKYENGVTLRSGFSIGGPPRPYCPYPVPRR